MYIGICNYGETENLQEVMPSLYGFAKKQDATNVIWGEYWDTKYFVDNSTKMSFEKMFHDMYELNPKTQ